MADVVVLGAGGYAQQVVWTLERRGRDRVVGLLDEAAERPGTYRDYPVASTLPALADEIGTRAFSLICGIGSQSVRARWVAQFGADYEFVSVIDPSTIVGPGATIGTNVVVLANSVCSVHCEIGDSTNINWQVLIAHHVRIGTNTNISSGVKLTGGARVGNNCDIGTGAVILPKVRIGNNVTVGAGAVVTRDLPDNVTAVGVPARVIRTEAE